MTDDGGVGGHENGNSLGPKKRRDDESRQWEQTGFTGGGRWGTIEQPQRNRIHLDQSGADKKSNLGKSCGELKTKKARSIRPGWKQRGDGPHPRLHKSTSPLTGTTTKRLRGGSDEEGENRTPKGPTTQGKR